MNELPWIAEARKYLGTHEKVNGKSNPVLLAMLQEMGKFNREQKAWWKETDTPWCGLFVGYCLGKAGRAVIKDWYRAKAWASAGLTKLAKPAYGCIAVKSRQGGGHVFFVVGKNAKGQILGLGGNQGNTVSIVPFNAADIDGYYWPSKLVGGKPVPSSPSPERYVLSSVTATAAHGASEA
ncbi:phage associated protein [Neisseria flavescens]|uniref:TIGR02594 family protein n=1 Tax=Neisseria flavescens NRL30031/H210 TaxID=546264 RepID=C0EP30_NEIFL|nr:TIGR02594 family protein [Neisseria flavescens]EEG33154.1 TIGR02594 family protein [Neisseria flavescens NRL30031/H210]SPY03866.1 phage associated protein [Neisseria meningitidis]STZ62676.1 phage associated protein [Neisseria flavescens]STZ62712.1 phage associated protein [Neisseria flavescens]